MTSLILFLFVAMMMVQRRCCCACTCPWCSNASDIPLELDIEVKDLEAVEGVGQPECPEGESCAASSAIYTVSRETSYLFSPPRCCEWSLDEIGVCDIEDIQVQVVQNGGGSLLRVELKDASNTKTYHKIYAVKPDCAAFATDVLTWQPLLSTGGTCNAGGATQSTVEVTSL